MDILVVVNYFLFGATGCNDRLLFDGYTNIVYAVLYNCLLVRLMFFSRLHHFFISPPITDRCSRGITYSGCPSMNASFCPSICPYDPGVHPVGMISYNFTDLGFCFMM